MWAEDLFPIRRSLIEEDHWQDYWRVGRIIVPVAPVAMASLHGRACRSNRMGSQGRQCGPLHGPVIHWSFSNMKDDGLSRQRPTSPHSLTRRGTRLIDADP